MAFSAGLTISDLSDYLAPGVECIKPVEFVEEPQPSTSAAADPAAAVAQIQLDTPDALVRRENEPRKLKKAEITLNDCLACSGCITSAESVLVAMQSHDEVYRALAADPDLVPVLSIAPQSLASLATLHSLSLEEALGGVRTFFKRHLGFHYVFDTTFARAISLRESRVELAERLRSRQRLPVLSSACPGWICYAEKTHGSLLPLISDVKSSMEVMGTLVKHSPSFLPDVEPASRSKLYHVSVMMCYDKKLEASRPDFVDPHSGQRDVDCVLTTGEVAAMMADKGYDFAYEARASVGHPSPEDGLVPPLVDGFGTSSGGYLLNAMRAVVDGLDTTLRSRARLIERKIRSDDHVEYAIVVDRPSGEEGSGDVLFRGAKCFGFRNLQNIVRKVGKDAGLAVTRGAAGKLASARENASTARASRAPGRGGQRSEWSLVERRSFDYIEVMACPGGCTNGGGQLAPPSGPVRGKWQSDAEGMPDVAGPTEERERTFAPREWVDQVERTYWKGQSPSSKACPPAHPSLQSILGDREPEQILGRAQDGVERLLQDTGRSSADLLCTVYHSVESAETNGFAVQW